MKARTKDTRRTFNEFRQVIEVGIVKLACERATDEDIAAMATAVEHLKENPSKYEYDVEFHDSLAVASHNSMLAATIHLVNNLIADVRIRFWDLPDYQERTQRLTMRSIRPYAIVTWSVPSLKCPAILPLWTSFLRSIPDAAWARRSRRSLNLISETHPPKVGVFLYAMQIVKSRQIFLCYFSKAKKMKRHA